MKKFLKVFLVLAMALTISGLASAATTVDFDAVALRPANDGSGYATITEYANGNGVNTNVPSAGQKVYYGTDYFNGMALSSLDSIEFTYKRANGGNNPYSNAVITDGSGNYGIISSQGGNTLWTDVSDPEYTEMRMRYDFAGNSGNQPYGFRFYEPSPDTGSWAHGTNLVWDDIKDWTLLSAGDSRPLYSGEGGSPRGPVDDGLAIMWGDSLNNYLGTRDIYDVTVSANGQQYVAGVVPEPISSTLFIVGAVTLGFRRFNKTSKV